MYFEVHFAATEFRRKILATAAPLFSFCLDCGAQKDSNETATRGLNNLKSPIGTRGHLVAATCGQFAARRGEEKAKM